MVQYSHVGPCSTLLLEQHTLDGRIRCGANLCGRQAAPLLQAGRRQDTGAHALLLPAVRAAAVLAACWRGALACKLAGSSVRLQNRERRQTISWLCMLNAMHMGSVNLIAALS